MIFKDLTSSNAPTWGAVGTAVVRFPERLQKKQDSVSQGKPSEIQVPTKRSSPSMQPFFPRLSVCRGFCFLGLNLIFKYFNAIFNILQIFSFDL